MWDKTYLCPICYSTVCSSVQPLCTLSCLSKSGLAPVVMAKAFSCAVTTIFPIQRQGLLSLCATSGRRAGAQHYCGREEGNANTGHGPPALTGFSQVCMSSGSQGHCLNLPPSCCSYSFLGAKPTAMRKQHSSKKSTGLWLYCWEY